MIKAYRRTSFRYDFIRENHEKEINFSFKFVSQEGKDKKKPHFKGLNLHFEFFNIENQKFKKAESMLHICRKADKNTAELHTMEMMYSILALKKSEYIEEIRERLEPMKKMPDAFTNDAKRVRIGIFEYLLGLQYTYLCNKKLSKTYLTSALKNCRNTPYEYEIKKLLKA